VFTVVKLSRICSCNDRGELALIIFFDSSDNFDEIVTCFALVGIDVGSFNGNSREI
jgi:hypothetical protein